MVAPTETARVEVQPLPLKFYAGSIVLAILGVLLLGLGGWLAADPESREAGSVLLVLGAIMAVAPVLNFVRRGRSRVTLEADAHGITTIRSGGQPERHSYDEMEWPLSVPESEKPVLDLGCGEENFYPGHIILGWLAQDVAGRHDKPS